MSPTLRPPRACALEARSKVHQGTRQPGSERTCLPGGHTASTDGQQDGRRATAHLRGGGPGPGALMPQQMEPRQMLQRGAAPSSAETPSNGSWPKPIRFSALESLDPGYPMTQKSQVTEGQEPRRQRRNGRDGVRRGRERPRTVGGR